MAIQHILPTTVEEKIKYVRCEISDVASRGENIPKGNFIVPC